MKLKNTTKSSESVSNVYSRLTQMVNAFSGFFILSVFSTQRVFAAEENALMDLFDTEAFRGSWRWFDKVNWLGGILNMLISIFCFIALFSIAFQIIITLAYFSQKPFWDNVHNIKQENVGQGFAGIPGYFKGIGSGKTGTGVDALLNIFYIFLPDVKNYSEMGDNRDSKLNDDESVGTWLIKTLPRKVLIMLLLSMGFNGSLLKCFGMVVDGLGVVTDRVATFQADKLVNDILNAGDNYETALGTSKQGFDKLQGTIFKKAYKEIMAEVGADNQTYDVKQKVGKTLENYVKSNFTKESVKSALVASSPSLGSNPELTNDDYADVTVNVTVGASNSQFGRISISMNDIVSSAISNGQLAENKYINVQLTLKKKAPSHNYLELN